MGKEKLDFCWLSIVPYPGWPEGSQHGGLRLYGDCSSAMTIVFDRLVRD